MPTLGVSDKPIAGRSEDWLSLSREACALAEFVAGCVTPLTIAVQGDWGSGKTSLLRMLEEDLSARAGERIEVVRFETWQYAQFGGGSTLPLSLLSMLARRLSPPGRLAPIANTLKRLAAPAAAIVVRGVSLGMVEREDFKGGAAAPVDFAEECDRLRRELQDAVNDKRRNGVDRVVVLIDDLDRIEATLAIDVLQTIKMFLDLEHCVFVLALDFAVVKEGVAAKFGIKDDRKARAFFDKIIQLPFQVPVANYDTGGFVRHLLANVHEAGFTDNEADVVVALARASITSNPRAIKRAINALHLNRMIAADTFDRLGTRRSAGLVTLFALLCLQARFPEAYSWLLAQQDAAAALQPFQRAANPNLTALLAPIAFTDERDRDDFSDFARLLALQVDALGDAGGFAQVLATTRSTSVGDQQTDYRFSAEMQAENRQMMQEVLAACQHALPGVVIAFAERRGEGVRLTAEPRPGVVLSLEHSKPWLGLSVEATASERTTIRDALPGAVLAPDGTIHVWTEPVSDTTRMWKRRELLHGAPDRFATAWHQLNGGPSVA